MRRVDAEGDSRGVRGQKQAGGRSRLRRAAIEWLERRELLSTSTSTLPSPTVLDPPNLTPNQQVQDISLATAAQALTASPDASTPSVSVDPINPLKMVAVWTDQDSAGYNAGNFVSPITSYIEGAFSIDGGKTWTAMPAAAFGTGGFGRGTASVNVQQDFSLTVPTNGTQNVFEQTTDASIAFDRSQNFYILSSTHNTANTAGALDLQRFAFTGNGTPTYNGFTQVYTWDMADSAAHSGTVDQVVTPVLAVDTNVPTFTDPTSGKTQTDQFSGNIYAVWAEIDSNTYGGITNFNPNTIRMAASSNAGLAFTHAAYVDDSSNANGHNTGVVTNPPPPQYPLHDSSARYAAPQVTISQGNVAGTVSPGQVTVVYDDYGTVAPLDQILDQTDLVGGTSEQFSPPAADLGFNTFQTATINGALTVVAQNLNTPIPVAVNITDTKFTTLEALDVTTTIDFDTLADLTVELIPPAAVNAVLLAKDPTYPGFITLYNQSLTGANLGATSNSSPANGQFAAGSGTVFDQEAVRSIRDGNVGAQAVGHFKPVDADLIADLKGLTAAQLNGTWNFEASYIASYTSTALRYVNGVTLNFSAGNNPGAAAGTAGAEVTIAGMNTLYGSLIPNINPTDTAAAAAYGTAVNTDNTASQFYNGVAGTNVSGRGNTVAPTQGAIPILPAPVIASDDTLGSFSQHEGRLYVAFTGEFTGAQAGNTDIFLMFSDDGGKTWTSNLGATNSAEQVDDDDAATDGFSASTPGNTLGRAQYQPQIQVDQSTGDVVLTFLDARNDPSNARVATYVAASNDGGNTFAAQVFANPTQTALNAVTGGTVNIGPVPDNQSTTGGVAAPLGYGTHQALIVTNGRIIPFWTSNQNMAVKPAIVDSILSLAAGPIVISSTQGPVGNSVDSTDAVNVTRAADGTTIANTIQVTFDEPIDPTTFKTTNVTVDYKSPSGATPISLPIVSVKALNATALGATEFAIVFNPAILASTSFVGTYSYVITPTGISDRIRHVISGGTVANGNVMDQNADGTPGAIPGDDYVVGQPAGFNSYAAGTLPLIVPGPHLLSTIAVDATTGAAIGSNANNQNDLVLNNTVSALQVTWDRNIQVSSLTAAQILSIIGPAGVISLAGVTITPLSVFAGGSQVAYAGGPVANIFKVTFPTQQLSGTYTMTIGTGIIAADGSGVDSNENAGLDVLRGTATNGITVPVTYSTSNAMTIQPVTVNTDGTTTPSFVMSPIVVPDDFPIQGDSGTISGITLTLNITYPTDPNLVAYLLSPAGTKINLFTNVGAGTKTANFTNTTFSDTASTSIDKAGAPFFGTFLPEAPFANLANNGENSLGTWELVIENEGNSTGTLSGYSLTFRKPVSATGLAEFPDDQSTLSFQVFNLAASNALANSTWTAIGPTGITPNTADGTGTLAGTVASIAVDPSDTTGNTVYVGTAAGGIWKTTDFLTNNPSGPTYVPLTDFGPSFAQNIGSLAVFGVNHDPAQTIIFAGTGFAQERTDNNTGAPNVLASTGEGGGMLRSMDGGKTWQVVGNFAGQSTYKIVVDPTPNLNGQAVVYAATSGGLYKSLDSGNSWQLLLGGNATDILLEPNSKSPTTGNLDTLYAAFSNPIAFSNAAYNYNGPVGIYVSTNQGQTLQAYTGLLGKDPLLVTPGFPAQPLPVANLVTPNNTNSAYIVLAKPALTGNTAENLAYQSWLYAAVENYDGTFQGLYVTKDAGENWTLVQLPNVAVGGPVKAAIPTNATAATNSYDPTSSQFNQEGAYDLTLTVDPTDPNIVYVGGSQNFQGSGMIRVDLTDLYDAHNLTSGSNDQSDGGQLFANGQGGATDENSAYNSPTGPQKQILNLRYAPNNGTPGTSPFNINATLVISNDAGGFVNTGTGVTWSLFDEPLKANAGDTTGSTNLHDVIDYVDPITGDVRIIFADDEGVFTALANPDGTLDNGIGTDVEPNYSRNGNLQDEEFNESASEPSAAAAAQAGAEFFASGPTTIAAQSPSNVLTSGDLTWDNTAVLNPSPTSPRNTTANSDINTVQRAGVGIATDQTGGVSASDSTGSPTLYEFDIPILGGNLTDFFRVNQFGQTTGLDANVNQEFPRQGYDGDAHEGGVIVNPVNNLAPDINGALTNGQIPVGEFEVNPLNGNQILLESASGNLYETINQGILWTPIGNAASFGSLDAIAFPNGFAGEVGHTAPLDVQISTVAYGAPDPNVSGGVGNLNNFIYVGTTGISYTPHSITEVPADPYIDPLDGLLYNDGKIYVTQAGGQGWTDISRGLDGSSVVGIYPDPDRGSHAAYAVTLTGVFFSADTIGLAQSGQTIWTNITSNLTSITRDAFNNAAYAQPTLTGFSYVPINPLNTATPPDYYNLAPAPVYNPVYASPYGGFSDIVADYRYEIPAPTNATQGTSIFYPVLYASGYGGVFRSIDNGATWTVFPDTDFDQAPVDGGYLPNVDVTNLQLALGDINPDTGHPVQATGDPEVLLATTFGRGDFAIRLAPDIIPDSIQFDTTLPDPYGSDSSGGLGITNVLEPYIDGVSEVSNFGQVITINLFDESPGPGFGTLLGTGTTNALGQFVVQIVDSGQDPSFFTSSTAAGDKVVGIQATDLSGASGNMTLFRYTLDTITPVTPDAPVLESTYDSGRSNSDDLTNLSVPGQAGPGAPLNIVTPTFDVTTSLPQANPLSPNPISLTVELLSSTSPNGPFFVIDSTQTGFINAAGTAETYMLTDPTIAALAQAGIDETFYYEALQIDVAGNVSQPASNLLSITVNTIAPPAPTGLTLTSISNTAPPQATFSVAGIQPNDQVLLYRSIGGSAPTLVGTGAINTTNGTVTLPVTDTDAFPDGIYTYYAVEEDVYGNFSPLSAGLTVTITTQTPPSRPILEGQYDTGRFNNDDVTDIAVPAPTPGSTPSFVVPVFDVNTTPPAVGQPAIATVQLFRATAPGGPYTLVGSTAFNGNPAMVGDSGLEAMVAAAFAAGTPIDQTFYYEADQINAAGIESPMSTALPVLVDTVTPPTLPAPTLDPSSNTGLNKSQLITNQTKPTIDVTNLLPGEQLFLYRSSGGKAPVLVGTGPINSTGAAIAATVQDTTGAVPDGVYQYFVAQRDLAGNISNFSMSIAVTVNTTTPVVPTIALLASDDTGLPSHPNVTSINTPAFVGTAQYNAVTNFPVAIINLATGGVIASAFPSANGTYLAQVTTALADGVYTLEARSTNQAGSFSYSSPLTITIKHTGPQLTPNLQISAATDTGVKGDGVTSNHAPKFVGTTDPGDTVSLYVLSNGVLSPVEATTTSSTVNGAFTLQLPFNLSDGTTQLVAQTSDIANNRGVLSAPLTIQITTTTGDYIAVGKAQLTVFDPYNETYYVRNLGSVQADVTPGRDIPIQYDLNGDGSTDLTAYRFNTAEYFGYLSNNSAVDQQFGAGGSSLPVSGYYGNSGTYIAGSYQAATATWVLAMPQPGGLIVNFGVPKVDVPVPAAYDGYNSTELAVFRNTTIFGGDADSFTVIGPGGFYEVSFTSAAVQKLGFTYKAGDIAAPGDYDGVGRSEFAIYRPSTGQFFILNTPSDTNTATWTLRTVTLNLPGGAKATDEPVSEDYDGNGKIDPAVYRPSNSTFYIISSATGLQSNIQFGPAGQSVAAAGPLLYRLTALFGTYASTGGYGTSVSIGTGGGTGTSASIIPGSGSGSGGGVVRAESIASPSAGTSSSPSSAGSPLATMIALAAPLPVTTTSPAPSTPAVSLAATASNSSVTIGAATPKTFAPITVAEATVPAAKVKLKKAAKPLVVDNKAPESEAKAKAAQAQAKAEKATTEAKSARLTTVARSNATKAQAKAHATTGALAAASLQHLVMAKKGHKKG